jgi:thiamine biosynthesis lipoprotein
MNILIDPLERTIAIRRQELRVMGMEILLVGPDVDLSGAAEVVEAVFTREELRFSRFRPDSELSRVNASSGEWTKVSAPFERLVRLSLRQANSTNGSFDPTVLDAILALGYDRDLPATACGRWTEVRQKPGAVLLPEGVGLDFGGIAKGWTADIAADEAVAAGLPWVIVSVDGNLKFAGDPPPLEIGVEDPANRSSLLTCLTLSQGALASSGTVVRSPTMTDVIQATVWAPTGAEAEVRAKWALLHGSSVAADIPCVMVTTGGEVIISFDTRGAAA